MVIWVAILLAFFSRGSFLIFLFIATEAFGTVQMLPGDGGGINLLPQTTCAAFLVLKIFSKPSNCLRAISLGLKYKQAGLFTLFIFSSLIGSRLLPSLFAEVIEVVPVSGGQVGTDILRPSFSNITQMCYLSISYATTLAFATIGSSNAVRKTYLWASFYGGWIIVLTGLVDFMLYNIGLSDLLAPFRTATYSLLTDVEAEGVKRVVGLMTEASAYGALCIGAAATLTFFTPLFETPLQRMLCVILVLLLLVMVVLSTSSGSYVGIAVFAIVYGTNLFARFLGLADRVRGPAKYELNICAIVLFLLSLLFVTVPAIFDPAIQMVDKLVFQKGETASYIERSMWTRVGWQAFLDSNGFGVGIGSIRVSNWAVSILGSTGILGGVLMFGFIVSQLLTRVKECSNECALFSSGLRMSLIPSLVMSMLSATMPDIGVSTAAALGLLIAARVPREVEYDSTGRKG